MPRLRRGWRKRPAQGNHVDDGAIYPIDSYLLPFFMAHDGVRMRNRIIWTFEHGLHCANRFSGRYETIAWFTKGSDYTFNLDPVRVPQKYPGKKYYKGPKVGQYSSNPLGKNPGDLWIIPNVKHNHPEKTEHPCQFPADLTEAAQRAKQGRGHDRGHGHHPPVTDADAATDTAIAARGQLDAVMQEWLAPLVDRIGKLERENGRLEQERDSQAETIAALRRQLAEARSAPPAAPQPASAAPPPSAYDDAPIAPAPVQGFWRRVRRVFGGAG